MDTIAELQAENKVLKDRLAAIRSTAEQINFTAWLTEANQYRIDYILEQSNLMVLSPFKGKLSPEVKKFINNLGGDHGNP